MSKIRKVCRYCGSEDIEFDGRLKWNFATQGWDILGVGYEYCKDECDGPTDADDKICDG